MDDAYELFQERAASEVRTRVLTTATDEDFHPIICLTTPTESFKVQEIPADAFATTEAIKFLFEETIPDTIITMKASQVAIAMQVWLEKADTPDLAKAAVFLALADQKGINGYYAQMARFTDGEWRIGDFEPSMLVHGPFAKIIATAFSALLEIDNDQGKDTAPVPPPPAD